MQEFKLRIEDRIYTVEMPVGYTDIGRLTWVNEKPGVFAVNPRGQRRWFRAKQKNGRPL